MATQLQLRRGTEAQNNAFTGAVGEVTFNTTNNSLRCHDGSTQGGYETLRKDLANSANITNCITRIPQDIKLELNNGVLTLKAGSTVYIPNGPQTYTPYVLDVDTTFNDKTKTGDQLLTFHPSMGVQVGATSGSVSGTTAPTVGYVYWYDTTNNVINRYGAVGSITASNVSFPFARVTMGATGVVSVDQVFNGFGHIGAFWYALPGVQYLIPNGINADGSKNNIIYTEKYVQGREVTFYYKNDIALFLNETGYPIVEGLSLVYFQEEEPARNGQYQRWYSPRENVWRTRTSTSDSQWTIARFAYLGAAKNSSQSPYNITTFKPKNVFTAVDYGDVQRLVSIATLPDYSAMVSMNNGAAAPANGWAVAYGSNATVQVKVNGVQVAQGDWYTGEWSGNWNMQIMVSAGDVVSGVAWKFMPFKGV